MYLFLHMTIIILNYYIRDCVFYVEKNCKYIKVLNSIVVSNDDDYHCFS